MLTGIPSTDFTLSRDFLVMQDDQMNVINSFKPQNLDVDDSTHLSSTVENSNKENDADPLASNEQEINEILIPTEEKKDNEKKNVRRSKRRINDKKNFCM